MVHFRWFYNFVILIIVDMLMNQPLVLVWLLNPACDPYCRKYWITETNFFTGLFCRSEDLFYIINFRHDDLVLAISVIVVHLGYKRPCPGGVYGDAVPQIDRFAIELGNIQMANNVYRVAYDAGVRRLVVASSNHAADWYEHALIHSHQKDVVSTSDLPVSDNFYGWAKASYELLAWPYASGGFGRELEFVHIRIGAPREMEAARYEGWSGEQLPAGSGLANFKRELGAYFSARDMTQLFRRGIETLDIANEHGIPWVVVHGISGNTRAFWSLETARTVLGYQPEDDSEVRFAADVNRLLTGPDATVAGGRVGA